MRREPLFVGEVLDDDWLSYSQGVGGLRIPLDRNLELTDDAIRPPHSRSDEQTPAGLEFKDFREVRVHGISYERRRTREEVCAGHSGQSHQAQIGHSAVVGFKALLVDSL